MKKRDDPRPPGKRIRDTHFPIVPFIERSGLYVARFIVYCNCPSHPGILKSDFSLFSECIERECRNLRRYDLEDRGNFDPEIISELLKVSRRSRIPSISIPPFKDGRRRYLWVLDRGNHVYFLRPEKQALVPELEADHYRLFL